MKLFGRNPTSLLKIFTVSYFVLFELATCFLLYPNRSFKLENCPHGGPATVHMRLFTYYESITDAYNSIIHDNKNLIWTLWSHSSAFQSSLIPMIGSQTEYFVPYVYNFTHGPIPIINFYDLCSILIILEDPSDASYFHQIHFREGHAWYTRLTLFPFRSGGSHSITITIRYHCFHLYAWQYKFLPSQFFLHFLACPYFQGTDISKLERFPQFYVCFHCSDSNAVIAIPSYTSIYQRAMYKFIRKTWTNIRIPMLVDIPGWLAEINYNKPCLGLRGILLSSLMACTFQRHPSSSVWGETGEKISLSPHSCIVS